MTSKIDLIEGCKGLVSRCDCKIILISMFGDLRAYLVTDVHLKTKEAPYIEINDAIDVTHIAKSCETNFAKGMSPQMLTERVQFIPHENFKFEHSDYIWFTKVTTEKLF